MACSSSSTKILGISNPTRTLDNNQVSFPGFGTIRRTSTSESLVAASDISETSSWSVASSFEELSLGNLVWSTQIDQSTEEPKVEWPSSEECSRQLTEAMCTLQNEGEELATIYDAEMEPVVQSDAALTESRGQVVFEDDLFAHPALGIFPYLIPPLGDDDDEIGSPETHFRSEGQIRQDFDIEDDASNSDDKEVFEHDFYQTRETSQQGQGKPMCFTKTSATVTVKKQSPKGAFRFCMPSFSVPPVLKVLAHGENPAKALLKNAFRFPSLIKKFRPSSAPDNDFFDQETETQRLGTQALTSTRFESVEDMERMNDALPVLKPEGGGLGDGPVDDTNSQRENSDQSSTDSSFVDVIVEGGEHNEVASDQQPSLALHDCWLERKDFLDSHVEYENSNDLCVIPTGPRSKVLPTAKPGSTEEKRQAEQFWYQVAVNAIPMNSLSSQGREDNKCSALQSGSQQPTNAAEPVLTSGKNEAKLQQMSSVTKEVESKISHLDLQNRSKDFSNLNLNRKESEIQTDSLNPTPNPIYTCSQDFQRPLKSTVLKGHTEVKPPNMNEQHTQDNTFTNLQELSTSLPQLPVSPYPMTSSTATHMCMTQRIEASEAQNVASSSEMTERGRKILESLISAPQPPSDIADIRMAVMQGDLRPEVLGIADCIRKERTTQEFTMKELHCPELPLKGVNLAQPHDCPEEAQNHAHEEDWGSNSSQEPEEYEPESYHSRRSRYLDVLQSSSNLIDTNLEAHNAEDQGTDEEYFADIDDSEIDDSEIDADTSPPSPSPSRYTKFRHWATDEDAIAFHSSPESSEALAPGRPTRAQIALLSRALHPPRRGSLFPLRKCIVVEMAAREEQGGESGGDEGEEKNVDVKEEEEEEFNEGNGKGSEKGLKFDVPSGSVMTEWQRLRVAELRGPKGSKMGPSVVRPKPIRSGLSGGTREDEEVGSETESEADGKRGYDREEIDFGDGHAKRRKVKS